LFHNHYEFSEYHVFLRLSFLLPLFVVDEAIM